MGNKIKNTYAKKGKGKTPKLKSKQKIVQNYLVSWIKMIL